MDTNSDYHRVLELAEEGKHEQAIECIQEHLENDPENIEILNDMGANLFCLGRGREAIGYLEKARALDSESEEVLWNLSEVYLAEGRPKEAVELFADMGRKGILNVDILNRTANVFLNENDPEAALQMLQRSLDLCPQQEIIKSMIQVIKRTIEQKTINEKFSTR